MGKLSEQEDIWQQQATAAAIASARATVSGDVALASTQVGKLNDRQWGWLASAILFGWIGTRYKQATAEGLAREGHVTKMDPSPRDSAIVESILKPLASLSQIDWARPLAAWSKQEMAGFIERAWALIKDAEAALDEMPDTVLHKPNPKRELDDGIPF